MTFFLIKLAAERKEATATIQKTAAPGDHPSDLEMEQLLQEVEEYTLASHLFWGLWGIISEHVNEIDFDYMEYARQRFKQYWLRKHEIFGSSGATAVSTEFLYGSKSEGLGRNNGHKFWSLSFSLVKDKKMSAEEKVPAPELPFAVVTGASKSRKPVGKATDGVGKRRVLLSPRELHYTANRAQTGEMRKKTFLPYRQARKYKKLLMLTNPEADRNRKLVVKDPCYSIVMYLTIVCNAGQSLITA
ncbi:hypothetical protein RJ639_012011 [Escallonia herrerae]|uniref:Choline kinase 2 n=1 Tax=Escallonia herrerae TaxID=1293975 RepID=A0AA88VL39_9ASTE|nr:hypothetical protein RJ639_012011 [Escallonia herrerae]